MPADDNALNLLLVSVAMEEIALSQLITAESQKIQYAIGVIPGLSPTATIDEVLSINYAVISTMQQALAYNYSLLPKLFVTLNEAEN